MRKNPLIIQVNVTANSGSTGRIAEQINQLAQKKGWETYFAYGRDIQPCKSKLIHVGNKWCVYEHYVESKFFDNEGHASRYATKAFVRRIKEIKPDIIHLHNLHDHWLNYEILFEYLNSTDIHVVWTLHDPWAFNDCGHFSLAGCYKWKDGGCTNGCPRKKNSTFKRLFEKTEKHFLKKRELLLANKNLTIVPNSKWMEDLARQSFLKDKPIHTILNGIDIESFKPTVDKAILQKYGLDGLKYVVGVASVWYENKGLKDYYQLADRIDDGIKVVLVGNGLDEEELKRHGIVMVPKTENVRELAAIYTGAEIVLNLSYQESFGLTSVEGFGCGCPTIVYNCTASPELVEGGTTGRVVEPYDIDGILKAIKELQSMDQKELSQVCRKRAEEFYNKEKLYQKYIELYESLYQDGSIS